MDPDIRENPHSPDVARQAYEMRKEQGFVGHCPGEGRGLPSLMAHLSKGGGPWLVERQATLTAGDQEFHLWETGPEETTVIVLYLTDEQGNKRRRWGPWRIYGTSLDKMVPMYKDILRRYYERPTQGQLEVG